jgi:hypothetical protein
MNASSSDLHGEQRIEPVPPETSCFVADIDTPLEQQILSLPKRQWIADIHHHREMDHLGLTVKKTGRDCASPDVRELTSPAQAGLL